MKKDIRRLYAISHDHTSNNYKPFFKMMDSITGACNIIWFVIIEDEFDYDFHCDSNSMPLMASMDGAGSLIYLGFFTKLFNPGIPLVSIGVEFLG